MSITLSQLLSVTNMISINSEHYVWYDEVIEEGLVHFKNPCTYHMFFLPRDAEATPSEENKGCYSFKLPDSSETILIEFLKVSPVTLADL